ncbi:hypothetical protein OG592_44060 (plasmid) [Streptomyces avidinii]|uniref:hypothetical protein n=1 Tax=Streptomyces avidinii TaxID=1895 RepID=UPI002F919D37|nr:hypothetical protein OG592_44060 [Streptomyces avidinii]
MPTRHFEVDVPIRHTTNRQLHGVHVFTGEASSPSEALRRAHEAYDAALAAQAAGLENPGKQPGGWGARGLRPDWALDWSAAKAGLWHNPYR